MIKSIRIGFSLILMSWTLLTDVLGKDMEFGRVITYENFDEYKNDLNKTYDHSYTETRCRKAYEENCRRIREHNSAAKNGRYSFELRANCLADLSPTQYMKKMVRLKSSPFLEAVDRTHQWFRNGLSNQQSEDGMLGASRQTEPLPDSFDWREKGFITSPKNQKSCGSCYAFSIALSIEGQVFKRTGKLIELSEQQIVDCSTVLGNHGCGGGSLRNTLRYLETTKGIMRNEDYPYAATQTRCAYNPSLAVVNVTSWAILPQGNEEAMKRAIATVGPIAVSINASPQTFQLYSHGIYDDPGCSSQTVNHAMLAVGYAPEYWILKNWWGDNWGEDGYMKIRRNQNKCGLANYVAYAVV